MNVPSDNAKHFPDDAELIGLLNVILECNPESGTLVWKRRPVHFFPNDHQAKAWNAHHPGRRAFTANNGSGYLRGTIFGKYFYAHRVIWAMTHGEWPIEIDHLNGDRSDNRIANLRSVTHADNTRNLTRPKSNSSGHLGVRWYPQIQKWEAYINVNRSRVWLGNFADEKEAVEARKIAEMQYGFHPNHGKAA